MKEWIPVSEELPDYFRRVLITYKDMNEGPIVMTAYLADKHNGVKPHWCWKNFDDTLVNEFVIAWMPLETKPYEAPTADVQCEVID